MKLFTYFSILILTGICFLTGPAPVSAEDEDLVSLLDKISQRIYSYPDRKNYEEIQIEKVMEMDKKWEPKKTTIIKQIVRDMDGKWDTEILEVTETENGKTTDITEEYIENINKHTHMILLDEPQEKPKNPQMAFLNNYFPFDESKRSEFDIHRLDDAVMEGKDVFVLESIAKAKDERRFEGKCYIDQNTFDVLKIDVKPSKNEKHVKEMRIEMEFEVLPEGYFAMKKKKEKSEAKLFFKTFRQITETEFMNAP